MLLLLLLVCAVRKFVQFKKKLQIGTEALIQTHRLRRLLSFYVPAERESCSARALRHRWNLLPGTVLFLQGRQNAVCCCHATKHLSDRSYWGTVTIAAAAAAATMLFGGFVCLLLQLRKFDSCTTHNYQYSGTVKLIAFLFLQFCSFVYSSCCSPSRLER